MSSGIIGVIPTWPDVCFAIDGEGFNAGGLFWFLVGGPFAFGGIEFGVNRLHVACDDLADDGVRGASEGAAIVIAVPNGGGDDGGETHHPRIFSYGAISCGGGTGLTARPNIGNIEAKACGLGTEGNGAGAWIGEDTFNHVGYLFVYDSFALSIFVFFNYISGGVFKFKDIGERLVDSTTGNGCVGVGMLDLANVTTGADGDGKTSGFGAVFATVGFITEFMGDFEAVIDAVKIEGLDGGNV